MTIIFSSPYKCNTLWKIWHKWGIFALHSYYCLFRPPSIDGRPQDLVSVFWKSISPIFWSQSPPFFHLHYFFPLASFLKGTSDIHCMAVLGLAQYCLAVLGLAQYCSAVLSSAQQCSAVLGSARHCFKRNFRHNCMPVLGLAQYCLAVLGLAQYCLAVLGLAQYCSAVLRSARQCSALF